MAEPDALNLSFLPDQSQVVLIGTAKSRDNSGLDNLPAIQNNLRDLEGIFRDKSIIGLPNITRILDPPNQDELATVLADIAQKATDTLVVYYAGHGLKARFERGLYLATGATTKEHCDANGLPFGKLRNTIANSPASKKILILDCCFAGEALNDEMGDEASLLASNIDNIKGTYSIASSPANKLSIAPVGAEYTAFTGELIGLLREGTGSNNPTLTLDEIFEHLRRRIVQKANLPEPQRKSLLDGSKIIFAKNHMGISALELRVTSLQESFNFRLAQIEKNIKALLESENLEKQGQEKDRGKEGISRRVFSILPSRLLFSAHAFTGPAITLLVTNRMAYQRYETDIRLEILAFTMLALSVVSLGISAYTLRKSLFSIGLPKPSSSGDTLYSPTNSFVASIIWFILMIPLAIVAPQPLFGSPYVGMPSKAPAPAAAGVSTYQADKFTDCIRDWLGTIPDPVKLKMLRNAVGSIDIGTFISDPRYADQRATFVKDNAIPCS